MQQRQFVISADNAKRLEAAAQWIDALPRFSEALLVAPTRAAGDELSRLVSRRRGGLWGLHRTTLHHLAAHWAMEALARQGLAPVSRLASEALAARAIHFCLRDSALQYFAPVAEMPGFPSALSKTLTQLRLQNVSPEELIKGGPPGQDLARLLVHYQSQLDERGLADQAKTLTLAAGGSGRWMTGWPTLFLDLSPSSLLERRFLGVVGQAASAIFATGLQGDDESLAAFCDGLGMTPTDLDHDPIPSRERSETDSLQSARRWIFHPGKTPEVESDGSIIFLSAPGEERECVEVVRLVLKGAAEGTPFDQMAVLLRDTRTYLPLFEDAFRRAGVPVHFTQGTRRPDPAGRSFLALLACAAEGLSASGFAEYLSLGQVPQCDPEESPSNPPIPWVPPLDGQLSFVTPDSPESDSREASSPGKEDPEKGAADEETHESMIIAGGLQAPFHWERLLTDAAVIGGGVERWERRLRGLQAEIQKRIGFLMGEDDTRAEALQVELRRLLNLERFALPLVAHLAAFPRDALWGEWLDVLRRLAVEALSDPSSILSVLAELTPMEEVGPVALPEVYQVLAERLSDLRMPPSDKPQGRVFVGTLQEAAGRTFLRVFVPGMAEGVFPRKAFEDPLLLDQHRRRVSSTLQRIEDRFAQERLLLRLALGAASRRLVLTYPRMDSVLGRPRVPSFYALDVLRAAEGRLPDLGQMEKRAARSSKTRLGWPAPRDPLEAIDDAEYDLATLDSLLRQEGPVKGWGRYLIQVNAPLARSLRNRGRRWRNFWSEADGIVDADEDTLKVLRGRSLKAIPYSPTSLQHYAACPYRFLLAAVHRLRPREERVAIEQLDPLTRGSLFHEVQYQLFGALEKAKLWPLDKSRKDAALDWADRVLQETADRFREELAPAIPGVWEGEVESLRSDLRGWVRNLIAGDPGWTPIHAEYSVGLEKKEGRDPHSRFKDVTVLGGYRLKGSVDWIERHQVTNGLRVVDHKTGRPPKKPPRFVAGGEILQPVLYSLIVDECLKGTVEVGRLFYCTHRGGYRRIDVPFGEEAVTSGQEVLDTIEAALEKGFLPAAPREDACRLCDFRPVCGPYEERRVGRKLQPVLEPLHYLRRLP